MTFEHLDFMYHLGYCNILTTEIYDCVIFLPHLLWLGNILRYTVFKFSNNWWLVPFMALYGIKF